MHEKHNLITNVAMHILETADVSEKKNMFIAERQRQCMEYPVKKAILTGGSGPIGLALIQRLLKENVEILLLQREHSAKRMYLPEDKRLHIEYCTLEELKSYVPTTHDYDVFFHLGWTKTRSDLRDNIEEQNKNVLYSCDAVDLAYRAGCHSFIGAGSQAEYGRHDEPLRGDTLCMPENAYGIMKLTACHATRNLCRKNGIRHIWPRILSVYGPFDNEFSVLISTILTMLEGQTPEFTEGEQIWDFLYVDDLADALFALAQRGVDGKIYTIGCGIRKTLREYLEIICKKIDPMINPIFGAIPYVENQNMFLLADISEIQTDTGWYPCTDFETGIQATIDFYRDEWLIKWKDEWQVLYDAYEK